MKYKTLKIPLFIFNGFLILFIILTLTNNLFTSLTRVIGLSGVMIIYMFLGISCLNELKQYRAFYFTTSLMSFTLFCKYYFWSFWDIPSLIIVPIFIIISLIFLKKNLKNNTTHLITFSILIILTTPLFIPFKDISREYIPIRWYNRYHDVEKGIHINLKDDFSSEKSKQLTIDGAALKEKHFYKKAIEKYLEALLIDPNCTHIMFDLAESYAYENQLEESVALMSKAISIDSTNHYFIAQRGFYHYKIGNNELAIKDLRHAISFRSDLYYYHLNLGLAYHYASKFSESCSEFNIAYKLHSDLKYNETVNEIKQTSCN